MIRRTEDAIRQYSGTPHPQVDWTTLGKNKNGQLVVQVTCPICNQKRFCSAYDTTRRIKEGTFNGRCHADRTVGKMRSDNTVGRLPHPCVDWTATRLMIVKGQRLNHVSVTCPICHEQRWNQITSTAIAIHKGVFTGKCIKCGSNAKKRDWLILSPGRKIEPSRGYIRLNRHAVPPDEQWLWDALRAKKVGSMVLEHRFVMSKVLGRPLRSNELVDHMDGNKLNNDPINLRLYIRGKNQPGETSGYGTYYHEWQLALAEIERLKALLAK